MLTYHDFQQLINTIFRVQSDNVQGLDEEWPLTLVDVVQYDHTPPDDLSRRAPFSLYFQAEDRLLLHQGAFTFHHDTLGEQMIFIVPIEHKNGYYIYQAVFN